jgi:TonB family protein
MNARHLLALVAILSLSLGRPLSAADQAAGAKFGYNVLLELNIDEKGTAVDGHVVSSDDTTFDHALDSIALTEAKAMKFPVRQKDGHPVNYTARAPFVFPIEGDEGPEANNGPKPKIHSAIKPVYPAELAAKGEVGGVIVELLVDAAGKVAQLQVLRSSHPEFAQATEAAVKQWVFSPATRDGAPVESRFRMAVPFMTDVSVPGWKWRFAPRPSIGNYTVMHATQPLPAAEAKPATPPAGK